jgi:hypothetical protein
MASYRGSPFEAGVGPTDNDIVLFAACPPPEELGFEPATGHWRRQLTLREVQAVWESRPVGMFRGARCMVLDDLGDRLHIGYLGHDGFEAERLGYWQVDRGVYELVAARGEITDIVEERTEYPQKPARNPAAVEAPQPGPAAQDYSGYPPAESSGYLSSTPAGSSPGYLPSGPIGYRTGSDSWAAAPDAARAPQVSEQGQSMTGPNTGSFPRVSDTGSFPRVSDTGSFPRVTDTGSFPRVTDTGSQPRTGDSGPIRRIADSGAYARPGYQTASEEVAGVAVPPPPAQSPLPLEAAAMRAASESRRTRDAVPSPPVPAEPPVQDADLPVQDADLPVQAAEPAPQPALAGVAAVSTALASAAAAGHAAAIADTAPPPAASAPAPATPAPSRPKGGRDSAQPAASILVPEAPDHAPPRAAPTQPAKAAPPATTTPARPTTAPAGRPAGSTAAALGQTVAPPPTPVTPAEAATRPESASTAPGQATATHLATPSAPASAAPSASTATEPSAPAPVASRVMPAPQSAGKADTPARPRRSARRRLATERLFAELANLAAIPVDSYAVGEEVEGALCLLQTEDGFEVFHSSEGNRHELQLFTTEESACFYLFGVLAAEAVRNGTLAPEAARRPPSRQAR